MATGARDASKAAQPRGGDGRAERGDARGTHHGCGRGVGRSAEREREREREAELRREAGTLERGSASGRLPALVAPEP
jgi:hypothetical protein